MLIFIKYFLSLWSEKKLTNIIIIINIVFTLLFQFLILYVLQNDNISFIIFILSFE